MRDQALPRSGATAVQRSTVQQSDAPAAFQSAVRAFGSAPVLILAHNDADGLSASAILARSLMRLGRAAEVRLVGRGENAWSDRMREELAEKPMGGLIVTDLGVRGGVIREDVPTIIIDHHVPQGEPHGATVITGFGLLPTPTSSLLAFRCMSTFVEVDDLLWLAALGIIGDMAEAAEFSEMERARAKYGITALRKATSLINQPRRSSSGDASPALALLLKACGPKEVFSGEHSETALLVAARDEVRAELERVRRIGPKVVGPVALIRFTSSCQVHPLIAQAWVGRLKDRVVIAANTGFRPGWVHFAARSGADIDLVAFLRRYAPPGADENYGGGHPRASGGALRVSDWNRFTSSLGFGPEMQVPP